MCDFILAEKIIRSIPVICWYEIAIAERVEHFEISKKKRHIKLETMHSSMTVP